MKDIEIILAANKIVQTVKNPPFNEYAVYLLHYNCGNLKGRTAFCVLVDNVGADYFDFHETKLALEYKIEVYLNILSSVSFHLTRTNAESFQGLKTSLSNPSEQQWVEKTKVPCNRIVELMKSPNI